MNREELKERAKALTVAPGTKYAILQSLIVDGALDIPVSSGDLVVHIRETYGKSWETNYIQTYMKKFLNAGIVRAVKPAQKRENFWVLACVSKNDALRDIGKIDKIKQLEENLFSEDLTNTLKKDFRHELDELHDNFGKNGNCSAFLLRKILEKLIIIAMLKNGFGTQLEDQNRPGGWKGLKDMIEVAAKAKVSGMPMLLPKTAAEIKGVKFLGDTAAHNPLVGVDMPSIVPQMPYIITAYKELAKHL